MVLLLLCLLTLFGGQSERLRVEGVARNGKIGAGVESASNGEVYYLDGLFAWDNEKVDGPVVVEGELHVDKGYRRKGTFPGTGNDVLFLKKYNILKAGKQKGSVREL